MPLWSIHRTSLKKTVFIRCVWFCSGKLHTRLGQLVLVSYASIIFHMNLQAAQLLPIYDQAAYIWDAKAATHGRYNGLHHE